MRFIRTNRRVSLVLVMRCTLSVIAQPFLMVDYLRSVISIAQTTRTSYTQHTLHRPTYRMFAGIETFDLCDIGGAGRACVCVCELCATMYETTKWYFIAAIRHLFTQILTWSCIS